MRPAARSLARKNAMAGAARQGAHHRDLTEADFPCTPAGHKALLARANYYRRGMKRAWASFFDALRESQEQWVDVRAAMESVEEARGAGDSERLETTLKTFQQLIQELGRQCRCPVCFDEVKAAEMNPQHRQFMKLLYCGHILCGGCAYAVKQGGSHKCPVCRDDIRAQIASAAAPVEGAESRLRPKRDAADLTAGEAAAQPAIPEGCVVARYGGQCYACEATWVSGATIAKHRRVEAKTVCVECAAAPMPCSSCGEDATLSDVLKNGKGEERRYYCLPCVQDKHASGEKGVVGAAQFLKKHAK